LIRDWAESSLMASVLETMSAAPSEAERREMIASRNARVVANLPLVAAQVKDFLNRGVCREDLFQDGVLGLLRAAELYDPEAGFRFSTYARYWIRCTIRRGISRIARPIRLPESAGRMAAAVERRRDAMARERGSRPLVSEVLDAMEDDGLVSPGMRGWIVRAVDLTEAGFVSSPELRPGVAISPPDDFPPPSIDDANRARMAAAMARMDDTMRAVLTLRHGLDGSRPLGVMAVGDRLDIPWTTVKRLEREAVAELRRLIETPDCPPPMKGRS
jgi:RNA polymerase sigma factor (sigma-70 family)